MKVSTWKRQQRHLRARRTYWASVYAQNGLRRVPLPFVECYSEEGEIVPLPPIQFTETHFRDLVPRRPAFSLDTTMPVYDWKPIVDHFSKEEREAVD